VGYRVGHRRGVATLVVEGSIPEYAGGQHSSAHLRLLEFPINLSHALFGLQHHDNHHSELDEPRQCRRANLLQCSQETQTINLVIVKGIVPTMI